MTDESLYLKPAGTTNRVSCADPETGNMHAAVSWAGGKFPYEPPVIETFYASRAGLPPGVIEEWAGKFLLRPENDEGPRKLRLDRPDGSLVGWRAILRTVTAKLGLQHQEPSKIG